MTASSPTPSSRLSRAAITLVELTLVLALAAIVVFVAIRSYSQASASSKYHQVMTLMGQVRAGVEQTKVVDGFAALPGSLYDVLPVSVQSSNFATSGNLISPTGGVLRIGPNTVSTAADTYYIAINNLAKSDCARVAMLDMGKSILAWSVDATNAIAAPGAEGFKYDSEPPTQARVKEACSGALNAVAWTLH